MILVDSDEVKWDSLDKIELNEIKYVMKEMAKNNYCTHPNMELIRTLEMSLRYDYSLINNKFLFSTHINPSECGGF